MTNGHPYEMLLPCWCGDRPILEVHDNHYWVSCSCESWKHDMLVPDYPEVGGYDGFETDEQAVMAWNKLMSGTGARFSITEGDEANGN